MCYSLSTSTADYASAAGGCSSKAGYLWFPKTAAESGQVEAGLGLTANSTQIWIGLNRSAAIPFEW